MTQLSNTNGILDSFQGHTLWSNITLTICTIEHLMYISHRQSVHLQRFETATAAREAICGAGPLVCRCCPKPSPGRMEGGEGEGRRCIVRRVAGESNPGGRITPLVRNIPLSEVPNREIHLSKI